MQKFGYEYNADGLVSRHTDSINGKTYNYTYDLLGRLQKTEISDGSSIGYTFDKVNNITNTSYRFGGVTKTTQYPAYFKGGVIKNVTYPNGATKTRSLNGQAQVRRSTLTTPAKKEWKINRIYYTPTVNGVSYTTDLMGNLIYENIDRTFSYTYNGSGNISKITDKVGTTAKESTFVYDEANQLIRENNAYTNKTVTYTYDAGGNILTKTEYPFTTGTLDGLTGTVVNYTYGNSNWKDLLTAYNGNAITYDQIGNPLTYYNGTTFTWERGRKLATATTADGTSISYKYNDSGIRTQKTVGGVATDYFLDGSKIIAEKTGNNTTWYYYDGDGTREAIEYNGNVYYYFYNAQGDVMGLYDNNLNVVVEYAYDSWGNTVSITGSLASTLGQDNPFRYRGYYFDSETNLYYLNSRYYDANTGRFINADDIDILDGGKDHLLENNIFAYCLNNPMIYSDDEGEWVHLAIGAAVGAVAGIAGTALNGERGVSLVVAGLAGAASGALAASGVGLIGQVVGGAALSATENFVNQKFIQKKKTIDKKSLVVNATFGAISGLIGGKGANGKKLQGIYKTSVTKLKTAKSATKIANYTYKKIAVRKDVAISTTRYILGSSFSISSSYIYGKYRR